MIRSLSTDWENALWMGFEVVWWRLLWKFWVYLFSRNLIWSSWILVCPCLMVITGYREITRFQGTYHVSFFPEDQAMDIVMAINMGSGWLCGKPFDQQVLLAKVQGLLRRSYEFGRESLLEYAGVILNKSMDLHYQGKSWIWPRMNSRFYACYLSMQAASASTWRPDAGTLEQWLFIDIPSLSMWLVCVLKSWRSRRW